MTRCRKLFGYQYSDDLVSAAGHLSTAVLVMALSILNSKTISEILFVPTLHMVIGVADEVLTHFSKESLTTDFSLIAQGSGLIPASIFAATCIALGAIQTFNYITNHVINCSIIILHFDSATNSFIKEVVRSC